MRPRAGASLDRFVAAGGTFIDTADVYSRGGSEEVIGRWLAGRRRDDLVIATKVRGEMGDGPNQVGLSRKHILEAVDASLRRLGTDYIDLYQVHSWDSATPLDETLSTLHGLITSGKVRYIGASNYPSWGLQKAVDLSRQMGWDQFVSLQPLYNLLDRDIEMGLLDVCRNEGLGIITWSPLRGGWLSGKYRRGMDTPPEGTRIARSIGQNWSEAWDKYNNEHTWRILDGVLAMAAETGRTPAQVSLRWVLQRPGHHRADHRGAHRGTTGREPRRCGLVADRRTDGAAQSGQRAVLDLPLLVHEDAHLEGERGVGHKWAAARALAAAQLSLADGVEGAALAR